MIHSYCYCFAVGYASVCINVDCGGADMPKPATTLSNLPQVAQKDKTRKVAKKAKLYTAAVGNGLQLKDASTDGKKELPRQRKRITLKLEEVVDAQKLVSHC